MKYYSIIGAETNKKQDQWVCETLNFKKNGVWVDIGCSYPVANGNNTYAMESQLDWSGVSLDFDQPSINAWSSSDRSLNGVVCQDALTTDYEALFEEHGLPTIIDYLSLDLEPPTRTLEALYRIPFDKYKFRCITYETDAYRGMGTEAPSRTFLESKGYKLVMAVNYQDDYWVYGEEL